MFDLDRQIGCWRQGLARSEVYGQSDLDELEAHLREETAALAGQGLSDREAFAVACMRMGNAEDLNPEFAKVNGAAVFRRRLFWMGAGVLGLGFAGYFGTALSKGATWLAAGSGLRGYTVGIIAESVHMLAVVALIMGLLAVARRPSGGLAAPAWLRSMRGKVTLFVGLVTLNLVLLAGPALLTAGTAHVLGPRDFGEIALVTGYANLFMAVAWSLLLIGWMVKAWTSATASPQS
jgi:hypothetical protein